MRLNTLPKDQPCLLLHAGSPKTGTDSIQRFFGYHARNKFRWIADFFELLGCSDYDSSNLSGLTAKIEQSAGNLQATDLEGIISRNTLHRHTGSLLSKHYIFSSEHAGRPSLTPNLAKKQQQFLQLYSAQPRVLYYMRNPFDQCLALIEQIIKEGYDLNSVLHQFLGRKPNMYNVLTFDALYTNSHVICVPYDRKKFPQGSILLDFLERVGISDNLDDISDFAADFTQFNGWLPLAILRLLNHVKQRVSIPAYSRLHFINSLMGVGFSGRRSVHSDFLTREQIMCLFNSARDEYDELGSYLDSEPYPKAKPLAEESYETSDDQNDQDYTENSNILFAAGDKIWSRLEELSVLTDRVYRRPPLSNMGPVGGHESLKRYIESLNNNRRQDSFSPKVICEISLDYVINTSHIWAEYKKADRATKK
jgi:hypothetical protein